MLDINLNCSRVSGGRFCASSTMMTNSLPSWASSTTCTSSIFCKRAVSWISPVSTPRSSKISFKSPAGDTRGATIKAVSFSGGSSCNIMRSNKDLPVPASPVSSMKPSSLRIPYRRTSLIFMCASDGKKKAGSGKSLKGGSSKPKNVV